jgi:beta-lactamase regulating signal transducer with metallopeptidase domain
MLGSGLSMLPVVISAWEIRRLRRRALPWRQRWGLVRSARLELDLRRNVQVLLDDMGPARFGILRPVVLLPLDVRDWRRADATRAVIHELEHVRWHDCLVQVLARIVCAMYWYHPLGWMAWRQVEVEAERACDDAVVRVGEPLQYADQLVALAERAVGRTRQPLRERPTVVEPGARY